VTELVQQHRAERDRDHHEPRDAAHPHEDDPEEDEEGQVDLDGEPEKGSDPPALVEHVFQGGYEDTRPQRP
jgi:hypothetical protein